MTEDKEIEFFKKQLKEIFVEEYFKTSNKVKNITDPKKLEFLKDVLADFSMFLIKERRVYL